MTSRAVPRLHLISDRALCPLEEFPPVARQAVAGGVDAVHIREKDLGGGILLDLARRVIDAVEGRALVIVNERVDVALLADADGVQLGETALSPELVRGLAGDRLVIGRSVHDRDGAVDAEASGADFLLAGNIFPTRSKAGLPGLGTNLLSDIVSACRIPVIGIGGITVERVGEVLGAGASGVAVISGILAAGDPERAAARYRAALARHQEN